jgi:hypothetical protein
MHKPIGLVCLFPVFQAEGKRQLAAGLCIEDAIFLCLCIFSLTFPENYAIIII